MSRKTKGQTNEFSNKELISIQELSENSKENQLKTQILKLEEKCIALSQVIDSLLKQNESKEEEISHLKAMLGKTVPIIGESNPIAINVTDEELIADIQLRKLKDAARTRELTLDEIKKFDLLVKNKRLAQGNATEIEGKTLSKQLPKTQLLQIASKKIEVKE